MSSLTRFCFFSENLFKALEPALRDNRYSIQQPVADPAVAMNAYNNIQRGCAVDKTSINASTLLGIGTKVESSKATTKSPNAPKVIKYSESRVRLFVSWWSSSFKYSLSIHIHLSAPPTLRWRRELS